MFSSSLTALPGSVQETDVTLSEVGHIHAHQLAIIVHPLQTMNPSHTPAPSTGKAWTDSTTLDSMNDLADPMGPQHLP